MEVKFRTLTPLFTGDKNTNQSEKLRETGIIGSLRFWGRAIARGLGYKVAGDDGKKIEIKSFNDICKKLDSNTRTFGCTDWKKTFRMEIIQPDKKKLLMNREAHVLAKNYGWSLKPGLFFPWNEPIQINISTRPFNDEHKWIGEESAGWLALVWHVIDRLCGIGAHQGWGYGQIRLVNNLKIIIKEEEEERNLPPDLPDLADFVFAEYEFPQNTDLELNSLDGASLYFEKGKSLKWEQSNSPALPKPIGLSLRYLLHYGDPPGYVSGLKWKEEFFGGRGKGSPAGRFHASFLYRVNSNGHPDPEGDHLRFRVWAWLPKNVFRDKETDGKPDWCSAAEMLRDELCCKDLWKAVANCAPPKESYFWPFTRANTRSEIKMLSPWLEKIEDRAANILGRKCV